MESAYSRRRDEPRIQPVVHISAIESPMPSLYVLPVALAAAFQVFIGNSSWVKVFSDFTGKQPNIGSLLFDEELNRPAIVTNVKARNTFIDEQCLDAIMVLDVLAGRAGLAVGVQIPALAAVDLGMGGLHQGIHCSSGKKAHGLTPFPQQR